MTNESNVQTSHNENQVFARNAVYGFAALALLWVLFNQPQWNGINLEHFDGLIALLLSVARFVAMLSLVGAVFDGLRGRYERALERGGRGAVTLAVLGLLSGLPVGALVAVGLIALVFVWRRFESHI
jgi:hypothetical protein